MEHKEIRIYTFGPVEIRQGADGKKRIVGYAVRWNLLSDPIYGVWRERFERGAFAQSLIDRQNEIFATWQHQVGDTLGRSPNTLSLREDDNGLIYEIDPPSWAARHIETIERGDVRGSSFVFIARVVEYDWDSDPNYVIRTVRKADLYEVAPVTMPAYPQSTASVRSSEAEVAEYIQAERARRVQAQRDYLARQKALRDVSIQSNIGERI